LDSCWGPSRGGPRDEPPTAFGLCRASAVASHGWPRSLPAEVERARGEEEYARRQCHQQWRWPRPPVEWRPDPSTEWGQRPPTLVFELLLLDLLLEGLISGRDRLGWESRNELGDRGFGLESYLGGIRSDEPAAKYA